jgi:hypothetical protein
VNINDLIIINELIKKYDNKKDSNEDANADMS